MKLIFLITQLQQGEWTLGAMVEARASREEEWVAWTSVGEMARTWNGL